MVTWTAMEVLALGNFLEGLAEFETLAEAAEVLALTGTEGAGYAGTIYSIAGGAAETVVSGTTGITEILTFAEEANLGATATEIASSGVGIVESAGGYTAAGILGMDIGIVGAAVSPLLGVAIGVGLYESNKDLWTKLSQKLLPFCYPDTTLIPTWAEIANSTWTVSISKSIVEAIRDLFLAEGVPINKYEFVDLPISDTDDVPGGSVLSTPYTYRGTTYGSGGTYFAWFTNYKGVEFSREPFSGYTDYNSSHHYYYREYGSPGTSDRPMFDAHSNETGRLVIGSAIDAILGNVEPSGEPPTYPAGTSKWSGETPTEIPETKPAVIGTGGETQPMVPISPPQTVPSPSTDPEVRPDDWPEELPAPIPTPSADPEEQPDPTTVTDPAKQVEPYIQPFPIPWQEIETQPLPNPQSDPSNPNPQQPEIPETVLPDIVPYGTSPIPSMPSTDLAFSQNVGLITVYHPTSAQLYSFEYWLWVTYADATIDKIFNNPFDGVIGLFELYCTPTDVGSRTIHCGFLDSGINSAVISRYTEINCGTIGIPEYYGNYLDYSPYSKAHIYLPFIGVQELNVDDIVGHSVNVTYRIDEYNGSCIAMITVAKVTEVNGEEVAYRNTMYQFSGNCAVELPIAGGSQASIKAGMMTASAYQQAANISAGAQLVGGLASLLSANPLGGLIGGVGGAMATAAYGQAQALQHMLSGKSTVQKSGSFGASYGAMGIKTPFITVTRPKQIQVPNYNLLYGFPAHKKVTIGSCTGFLRCREVHVMSAQATDEEKTMIEQLLKSGVYVTE